MSNYKRTTDKRYKALFAAQDALTAHWAAAINARGWGLSQPELNRQALEICATHNIRLATTHQALLFDHNAACRSLCAKLCCFWHTWPDSDGNKVGQHVWRDTTTPFFEDKPVILRKANDKE